MAISFNPQATTCPGSSFLQSTMGYVQGSFLDDPTSRMYLAAAQVASTVTQPVWGAMAITEGVALDSTSGGQVGGGLTLATNSASTTGFTVFNQAANGIIVPGNTVQQYTAGMTISFFRLGSNARIVVQVDPSVVASLDAGAINQQVSWDYTNQKLVAFNATPGALPCKVLSVNTNSKIVSYNAGTGALTWTAGAVAVIQI